MGDRFIEPEYVRHWRCPKAGIEPDSMGDGVRVPLMTLTQSLDDPAGRQRRYVCPACEIEITVDFPPEDA